MLGTNMAITNSNKRKGTFTKCDESCKLYGLIAKMSEIKENSHKCRISR